MQHHVGGHLKVAPEHTDSNVLRLMKKPDSHDFEGFAQAIQKASSAAGKNFSRKPRDPWALYAQTQGLRAITM